MQTVFYLVGGHSKSQSDFIPICRRSLEMILRSAAALELRAIASMSISDIDIDTWLSRSMSRKDRRKTKFWIFLKKSGRQVEKFNFRSKSESKCEQVPRRLCESTETIKTRESASNIFRPKIACCVGCWFCQRQTFEWKIELKSKRKEIWSPSCFRNFSVNRCISWHSCKGSYLVRRELNWPLYDCSHSKDYAV